MTGCLALVLLFLCACSDLPFGLGDDPGRRLIVTRGSEILRVSVGSGDVDVLRRIEGRFRQADLGERTGVLHVFFEREGGGHGLVGVDVCTGHTIYERAIFSEVLQLSHDEDLLFAHVGAAFPEIPRVKVLDARTGDELREVNPLEALSIDLIQPGPAYPGGAVVVRGRRELDRPRSPRPETRIYVLDAPFTSVLDSIRGGFWDVQPGADGRSLYLVSRMSILRYDLVTRTVVGEIRTQVRHPYTHRTVLADGRILVTDAGFQLDLSSGNVYLVSPDLERVDTVDVGELIGDPRRATTRAVADLSEGRAYILSPKSAWTNPQHVLLLVLDFETRKLVEVVDLGSSFSFPPEMFLHPGC